LTPRLPLSVQHEVPSFVGPVTTALLWLAVTLGQFDPTGERLLYPYAVILLLPPVGRAVWSVVVRRPVVTGAVDQRLYGADMLLLAVALLQAGRGTASPLLVVLYAGACYLGLLLGARRLLPALGLTAVAMLLATLRGAIDGDAGGLIVAMAGLFGFALGPAMVLTRTRDEASHARQTLQVIEKTARDLGEDSTRRQQEVRKASFAPEDVEAELQALGLRASDWLSDTCRTLVLGTGADRALVYRASEDGAALMLQAAGDDPGDVVSEIDPRAGVFGLVYKTGEPLLMPTVGDSYGGIAYCRDHDRVDSLVVVPVYRGEQRPWGAIVLDAAHPESLAERDRDLVAGIAPLLVTLFDQLVDLTAYRRGSGEDKMLHDTSQLLAEQESLEGLTDVLVSRLVEVLSAQGGALVLVEPDSSLQVVRAVGFKDNPAGLRFAFDKTTSLVAQAILYGRSLNHAGMGTKRKHAQLFGDEYGPTESVTDLLVLPLMKPGLGADEHVALGAICVGRNHGEPFAEDDQGRAEMLVNQASAHLMNIQLLEDSRTQAATDGLTGLPNRRAFVEKLDEMLHRAARFGTPVSMLMLDVDHFKKVNDTYGHPVGDQVLRRLAGLLHESIREAVDIAARFGGEEFAVLLENTAMDGALNLAERLRSGLEDETFIHMEGSQATQFHVTVSIGVASYPEAGDAMVLVGRADEALYKAKETGRNRVISAKEL
jgi:two-component system, cell cycle response regulator